MIRTASQLAESLCENLVVEVASRNNRSFIVSSLSYPDGETITVYIDHDRDSGWLTDRGTTLYKLELNGVKASKNRAERIDRVCQNYAIERRDDELRVRLTNDGIHDAFVRLCEASLVVFSTQSTQDRHGPSGFAIALESVLLSEITPFRPWTARWTDPTFDPRGAFPVDYRFNGENSPRHLFQVSTTYKAALVSAVSGFYQSNGVYVPTMTVINPDFNLGDRHIDRLQLASTELCWGLDAARIREFVLMDSVS